MADNEEQKKPNKDQAPKMPGRRRASPIRPERQESIPENIGTETTEATNEQVQDNTTAQAQDNSQAAEQTSAQTGILKSSSYDDLNERVLTDRWAAQGKSSSTEKTPLRTRQTTRSVSFEEGIPQIERTEARKEKRKPRRGRKPVKTKNTSASALEQAQEMQKDMKAMEAALQAMMPAAAQSPATSGSVQEASQATSPYAALGGPATNIAQQPTSSQNQDERKPAAKKTKKKENKSGRKMGG